MPATRPDIVFLDIEMPGLSGVQLAERTAGRPPVIVFITAFSQYAVAGVRRRGNGLRAETVFRRALPRGARRARSGGSASAASASWRADGGRRPELQQRRRRILTLRLAVPAAPVAQAGRRARSSLRDGRDRLDRGAGLLRDGALDARPVTWSARSLTPSRRSSIRTSFVRAHRTAIVNVQHVRETHDRDGLRLVLSDGSAVAVSRSRKHQVEARVVSKVALSTQRMAARARPAAQDALPCKDV